MKSSDFENKRYRCPKCGRTGDVLEKGEFLVVFATGKVRVFHEVCWNEALVAFLSSQVPEAEELRLVEVN